MMVKILRDVWILSGQYFVMTLGLIAPFLENNAFKDLKRLTLESKRILNVLRETPVEELKKDEVYTDAIYEIHKMIFNLETLLWDYDFNFEVINKADFYKYAKELHKNTQKIYLIITENLTQEDKKKFIKKRIKMLKTNYEKSEAQIVLYIGKCLIRKKICSKGLTKSFISLKGNEFIETLMKTVSQKDPANEFDYITFFEEIENEMKDELVKWAMKELA